MKSSDGIRCSRCQTIAQSMQRRNYILGILEAVATAVGSIDAFELKAAAPFTRSFAITFDLWPFALIAAPPSPNEQDGLFML